MRPTRIGGADLDAETLQTDVMRFMAILSFCLMAILALVRNVDSLPGPAPTKADPSRSVPPPRPPERKIEPAPQPPPAAPAPAAEKFSLEPRAKRPVPIKPQTLSALPPPPTMAPPPRPSAPVAVNKQAAAPAPKAQSLVLRFASDTDFLKLVSNAVVEVYAYDAAAAFKLSPGLTFTPAARPPQVHELLEETIPSLVREALAHAPREGGPLVWGVRLPPDIESSIKRHLAQQRTGVLLIDRQGSVRHAPAS